MLPWQKPAVGAISPLMQVDAAPAEEIATKAITAAKKRAIGK
jgi:hypothetical protein